jgi:glucose/arabinose dehydrogenase
MKCAVVLFAGVLCGCSAAGQNRDASQGVDRRPPNASDQKPAFVGQTRAPERHSNIAINIVTVAAKLDHPWGLAFLPDGRLLVTERDGRMRTVGKDGALSNAIQGLPPVDARGQGGLLGLALDPEFATNRLVYWSYSEPPSHAAACRTTDRVSTTCR